MKIVLVSAAALIDADNRILLTQRPAHKHMGGMWEFPGGKVEEGETPEKAIVREIREELSIELCESCLAPVQFVSHAYEDFHLLMLLYACRKWDGVMQPTEAQAMQWLYWQELRNMPMPPADSPLVAALYDFLSLKN